MTASEVVSFVVKAYQLFYADDDSSSDEDEEEEEEEEEPNSNEHDRTTRNGGRTRQYVLIGNTLARNDGQFKAQFRVNRSTVESLCGLIERCTSSSTDAHFGRPSLPVQTQLLVAIWVLVTQESYREVSQRFDVAKSTAIKCVHCVCSALLELSDSFVTWPTEEQAAVTADTFRKQSGLTGVIGCINRIRISTKVFTERSPCGSNAESTKSAPYVVLQAVCDEKMMFTDCFASHIGSAQNKIYQKLYNLDSVLRQPPEELFYGKYHLLGDESYPLSAHLLTPHLGVHLTKSQHRYNGCHSSVWSTVNRAFDLLRARFRRLAFIDMNVPQMVRVAVQATCVLHNYCLMNNDHAYEFLGSSGRRIRHQSSEERVPPLDVPDWSDDQAAGQAKRSEIEHLLK